MKTPSTDFLRQLRAAFPRNSRIDTMSRGLFATDASMYQQYPLAVVSPRTREEAISAVALARRHGVPVLARGGGTSLAGQATARGALVVDVSRHLDKIGLIDLEEMIAEVEPGVIRDDLNKALAQRGVMFAPETSTSDRANIGGMVANNSSGMMSIRYGRTLEHVEGLNVLLATGEHFRAGRREEMDETGNRLLDGLTEIVDRNRNLIRERFPRVLRRVGGYCLDEFLEGEPNLAKIFCGSEGTLGLILDARVRLMPLPRGILALAIHFDSVTSALSAMPAINAHEPLSAELMDRELIELSRKNPSTAKLCDWVIGEPGAVIAVEAEGEDLEEAKGKLRALEDDLAQRGIGAECARLFTPAEREKIVTVRKAGLGVMLRMMGDAKPQAIIEDSAIPVENLAEYYQKVQKICDVEGVRLISYGHASVGVIHFRPVLNLKSEEDRKKLDRIARSVVELVRHYGGSWAGEHGDGIARGALNPLFWGEEMIGVFREVKRLFDPEGLFNPGKIFDTPPLTKDLRFRSGENPWTGETWFHFRQEGGFPGAVEMCNGVGVCRKTGTGTMCPSYMATRDEEHTTRGRANGLRLALSGRMGPAAFPSERLRQVLDLCLECKACATECPSNVDMARMKSEFLAHYHAEHGASWRDRLFAFNPEAARRAAGWLAPMANAAARSGFFRKQVAGRIGVARERVIPAFARQTFSDWFDRRTQPESPTSVVLFDDTYINYYEPEIGKAAVAILEHLGYRVIRANAGCCARTWISKGFLDDAKQRGGATMRRLDRYAKRGLKIVVLEPSCLSSLRHDLPDLIEDEALGKRISSAAESLEGFLCAEYRARGEAPKLANPGGGFLLHGHCHQKALEGTEAVHECLRDMGQGYLLREVDSGCCGMAGSFGYEAEHYDISMKIGELRLFPAVRRAEEETTIIADGFSCRHQIKDGTRRQALHFAEAYARALGLKY